ncbi:MAG: hypothetical protein LW832_06475 [Parachlamydia sp.]|jgi:hypothetical protein|nr:hypothetical protein [Parachlamydia sp.]
MNVNDKSPFSISPYSQPSESAAPSICEKIVRKVVEKQASNNFGSSKPILQGRRITKGAIAGQAKLHQAIRQAKSYAASQSELKPMGKSANEVFKLGKQKGYVGTDGKITFGKNEAEIAAEKESLDDPDFVSTYFKMTKETTVGEKSAGLMEKMVYDFAVILGLEEQFAPTAMTRVFYGQDFSNAQEAHEFKDLKADQRSGWDEEGRLLPLSDTSKGLDGGIQAAQQGHTLKDWKQLTGPKTKLIQSEVNQALVTAIVFGMWDAHLGNIILTEEGQLKFFDNTRSLPHSNGTIDSGGYLVSAFRIGLLGLPASKIPLKNEEKIEMKEQILSMDQKMQDLKKYIASIGNSIKRLPYGWFETEKVIAAMNERIELLKNAIDNEEVETLVDLAMHAVPGYKFSMGLEMISNILDTQKTMTSKEIILRTYPLHNNIGFTHIDVLLEKLADAGIDSSKVMAFCEEATTSKQLLEGIYEIYKVSKDSKLQLEGEIETTRHLIAENNDTFKKLNEELEKAETEDELEAVSSLIVELMTDNDHLQSTLGRLLKEKREEAQAISLGREKVLEEMKEKSEKDYKDHPREFCDLLK